jgi:hypothetical protein
MRVQTTAMPDHCYSSTLGGYPTAKNFDFEVKFEPSTTSTVTLDTVTTLNSNLCNRYWSLDINVPASSGFTKL